MPIGTTNAISGPYYGNGVATAFPFTFEVLSADQVAVYVNGGVASPNSYSVALTGPSPSAGTVTFNTAPASDVVIYTVLDPSFAQGIEFSDGAPYLAKPVNDGYDQSALRDQVLARDIARAMLVPMGDDGLVLPKASDRAGKYLGFDPVTGGPVAIEGMGSATDAAFVVADDGAGGANFGTVANFFTKLRSSLGGTLVNWINGVTGGVARSVATKLADHISVKDFGAKGDGSTDDTAAITAAVSYMAANANGGSLYFPSGTYRITSEIAIPFSTGWRIFGAARGNTTIRQDTNNARIFHLTGDLSYGFKFADLTLGWLNTQSATNTNAIAIHMDNSAGTLYGYFNCTFERLTINSGYRGICGTFTSQTPSWGTRFVDCSFGGTMSGASIYLVPSPAVGQPNIMLENVYISTNPSEPSVQISYCDNLVLKNVEWNGGQSTGSQNVPLFQLTQSNVTVLGCRSEAYDFTTYSGGVIWAFVQCTFTLIGCTIASIKATGGSSNSNIAVRGNVNSRGTLLSLSVSAQTTGWVTAYSITEVTFIDKVALSGNVTDNTKTYLGFDSVKKLDLSVQLPDLTEFRGDASITLTSAMGKLQILNVVLTADRTITLPGSNSLPVGAVFDIIRNGGAAPGAFALTIIDPISGQNHTFPANTNGSVRYRANGVSYTKIVATTFNATS